MNDTTVPPELSTIPEAAWAEARRFFPVIQKLANTPRRTEAQVAAAAVELGLSRTQVYERLARFITDPRLTSLLPRRRGPTPGGSRLANDINLLIDETIESFFLTRQRPRLLDLLMEIRRRCRAAGLTAPSRKAVTARVKAKPRREIVARRHGHKAARDQYAPAIGALESDWPLALVQIDHTLVDIIVVDSLTRAPIQRPWLTLAIDVCTRCVVGFQLSLEAPSATSVALCITHAVLPKSPWLAERKIIWFSTLRSGSAGIRCTDSGGRRETMIRQVRMTESEQDNQFDPRIALYCIFPNCPYVAFLIPISPFCQSAGRCMLALSNGKRV